MMRKTSVIFVVITFFTASVVYAQEKITEEQAVRLIQQYKAREEAANAKIKEEEEKAEKCKGAIAELTAAVSSLEEQIAKAKEELAKPKYSIYVVRSGDWLAKLAEYPEVYGRGYYALWRVIYEENRDLIRNPDLIYPGWELKVPPLSEGEKRARNAEILSRLRR